MITGLLAGAAKTMVVSMLSEVEANTKAIEENGKAVAEMVNLLREKVTK